MVRTLSNLFLLLVLTAATAVFAQLSTSGRPPIPKLTSPVYDETGTLSADEIASLESKLRRYEDSTSTQVAIMIIKTLDGYPASDYAIEAAQENKIGQSKKNNGALIMLAKNDRKGFIATGYGLEPTLTDAMTSQIYREILVPALKQNDFYGGLSRSIDAIEQAIGGEFKAVPKSRRIGRDGGGAMIWVVLMFVVFIILRALFGTGTRRTVVGSGGHGSGCMGGILQGLFWSSIFNNIGRRGSGWGGSSGGGFGGGGWSGGGGSFGGGGAGGDW